jgi:hypothetical protein
VEESPWDDGITKGTFFSTGRLIVSVLFCSTSMDDLTGPDTAEFLTTSRSLLT